MYQAIVKGKALNEGRITINVEFTDGTNSTIETCIPQDADAFKAWVKERLRFYNASAILDTELQENATIGTSDPIVVEPVIPPAVIARNNWIDLYNKWVKVKTTLVDTGVLAGTETALVNLRNKVKNDFLPDYINHI